HSGTTEAAPVFGSIQAGRNPPWPLADSDRSASVMMPMDFCASLLPCEKASALADKSWARRDAECTVEARDRRIGHKSPIIVATASKKPMVGDDTRGISTFL